MRAFFLGLKTSHASWAFQFFSHLTMLFNKTFTNSDVRRGEDDGNDHIDSDTPRSGVATPQPDPSDKRLPGIMHSFFGQVGSGSSKRPNSEPLETPALRNEAEDPPPFHHREEMAGDYVLLSVASEPKDETANEPKDEERERYRSIHMSGKNFLKHPRS